MTLLIASISASAFLGLHVSAQSITSTTITITETVTVTSSYESNLQTDALGYVAQQTVSHAALIFATLAAAFTFATGFKPKRRGARATYIFFLTVLLATAIYSTLKLFFYGKLANAILLNPPTVQLFANCRAYHPLPENATLTDYWGCIREIAYNSGKIPSSIPIAGNSSWLSLIGGTTISTVVSIVIGFIFALMIWRTLTDRN